METLVREIEHPTVRVVRRFVKRFVVMTETDLDIVARYVASTHWASTHWAADRETTPYLYIHGPAGSGKSRLLDVIAPLCYRPVRFTGADTVASILTRLDDNQPCTALFDEVNNADANDPVSHVFNVGFLRWQGVVARCAVDDVCLYRVYGPKIIASRAPLRDDLRSRALVVTLAPSLAAPEVLPASFVDEASTLAQELF